MTVLLLPRLTLLGVSNVLEASGAAPPTPQTANEVLEHGASMLSFAASGGRRSEDLAHRIGDGIRGIATSCGCPENSSQVSRSKFDHEVAVLLASLPELETGEALRDDVWSYLATAVLPDVVSWRFPDRAKHRFAGGVRNTLQRLWVRGTVLDRGHGHPERWGLVRSLSEDAAVQIFERASIAGNRRLALAMAEAWVRFGERIGRSRMEPVMRRATKLIRLRNEIIDAAGLPEGALEALVVSAFELAWQSLEGEGPKGR